ncbi:hypothetical protein E2562_031448 [Oryza meyeriana var. granulata]|uniref:Uncharacterized protein n=1 Tax=Oryza meyeriana var. granulata TaxID=110450 RepID=A0A6G1C1S6_9ORYZ|nr:hypothetical protein E2562_031448 [Oryza meyeriana var. granulata]
MVKPLLPHLPLSHIVALLCRPYHLTPASSRPPEAINSTTEAPSPFSPPRLSLPNSLTPPSSRTPSTAVDPLLRSLASTASFAVAQGVLVTVCMKPKAAAPPPSLRAQGAPLLKPCRQTFSAPVVVAILLGETLVPRPSS